MQEDKDKLTISANNYSGEPETSFDIINKYGTYQIQPTTDTENPFPKISQALPKKKNRKHL